MSLVLCVVAGLLWVRSYLLLDRWQILQPRSGIIGMPVRHRQCDINSASGAIEFVVSWGSEANTTYRFPAWQTWHTSHPLGWLNLHRSWYSRNDLAFYGSGVGGKFLGRGQEVALKFHYALLAVVLAVLPLIWLRRYVSRAKPEGYCPNCGYDLRATPDRCPECGTVPAKP